MVGGLDAYPLWLIVALDAYPLWLIVGCWLAWWAGCQVAGTWWLTGWIADWLAAWLPTGLTGRPAAWRSKCMAFAHLFGWILKCPGSNLFACFYS